MLNEVFVSESETNEDPLPSSEDFSLEIENRVWQDKDEDSYIYHTAKYIEELGLDAKEGKRLISPSLLDKITHEATENIMLKERNTTSSVFGF